MPPRDLQWVVVDDWRAGIRARVDPATISGNVARLPGAADSSGTYRCHALPNGSLAPLPRRTTTFTPSSIPITIGTITEGRLPIVGFWSNGPIQTGVEFHLAYEGTRDVSGTNRRWFYWQRIRNFDANQVDTIISHNPCAGSAAASSMRPCWFHNYRCDATTQTNPGLPRVVAGWFAGGGGAERVWHLFPNVTTPTSDTAQAIEISALSGSHPRVDPSHAFAHQGRAVVLDQSSYSYGANSYVWTHNEDVYYTDANLDSGAIALASTYGSENASGYSAAVSTNYSELLLMKVAGGGLLLRGDVDDPTVLRIPGIPALGNTRHQPTTSPVGVVFIAGDTGAWLWNGGETAENISADAIDGNEFNLAAGGLATDFIDYVGRLWHWYDWVVFPNNWMWNWKEQSWWRLENPSDVVLFHVGPEHVIETYLLATPAYVTSASDPFIYYYDYQSPATTFRYTSLPMPLGEKRDLKIRQMVLAASGNGTATVALRKLDGTTESHTFTVSSTSRPQYFRDNCNVDADEIQYRIDTTNSGTPVVIHELRLGYLEDSHLPVV